MACRLPLGRRAGHFRTRTPTKSGMYYEEDSRRLGILGGFALGVAFGAGVGLLLVGARSPASDAVSRARALRASRGGGVRAGGGGAAGRMARRRFRL